MAIITPTTSTFNPIETFPPEAEKFVDQLIQNQIFVFPSTAPLLKDRVQATLVNLAQNLPSRQFLESLSKSLQKDHASIRFVEGEAPPQDQTPYTIAVSARETNPEDLLDTLIALQGTIHAPSPPLLSSEQAFIQALENGNEQLVRKYVLESITLYKMENPGFSSPDYPEINDLDLSQVDRSRLFDLRTIDKSGIEATAYLNNNLIHNEKVTKAVQFVEQALKDIGQADKVKDVERMIQTPTRKIETPIKKIEIQSTWTVWFKDLLSQIFAWFKHLFD